VNEGCTVSARFYRPSPALAGYFTTFYQSEVTVPNGGRVTDHLHPEWGGLRFMVGDLPESQIGQAPPISGRSFLAQGPTSTSVRFTVGPLRMWGLGLLPLGWAKFVGVPAVELADTMVDGREHPAFADFVPLADTLFGETPDPAAELTRLEAHFLARLDRRVPDEARIVAAHEALIDPDVSSVAEMAERARIAPYTLERICRRAFGFPPQLLLRRQRFMRSIAQFMLDPSLKWIGALDDHYHDQAQFVREFHRFMGMGPREYSSRPHPILGAIMRARHESAGAAVQALHSPLPRQDTAPHA
jgi:AraC-like DNA-binding protein